MAKSTSISVETWILKKKQDIATSVINFVQVSSHFGETHERKSALEKMADQSQRSAWSWSKSNVQNMQAQTMDGWMNFGYRYEMVKPDPKAFQQLATLWSQIREYTPSIYASTYFKQLIAQQAMVNHVMEAIQFTEKQKTLVSQDSSSSSSSGNENENESDQESNLDNAVDLLLEIFRLTLMHLDNSPYFMTPYAVSVLRDLALFVGSHALNTKPEGQKHLENRQQQQQLLDFDFLSNEQNSNNRPVEEDNGIVWKIFSLILRYNAQHFATPLFQPTPQDISQHGLLDKMFNTEYARQHGESNDGLINLLRQIPFGQVRQCGFSADQTREVFLDPIRQALAMGNVKMGMKLLMYLSRIVLALVHQYPHELAMDGVLSITRANYSLSGKAIIFCMFENIPIKSIQDTNLMTLLLQEIYGLRQPFHILDEKEKHAHMMQFINKTMIPCHNLVQIIYGMDENLKRANMARAFPIVNVLRKLAIATRGNETDSEETDSNKLFSNIIEILSSFAIMGGAFAKADLPHIETLRLETMSTIQQLVIEIPETIPQLLEGIFHRISFMIHTHPKVMDSISIFIKALPKQHFLLRMSDTDTIETILSGGNRVPEHWQYSHHASSNAAIQIARLFISQIPWELQQPKVRFQMLQIMLRHAGLNSNTYQWVSQVLSTTVICQQLTTNLSTSLIAEIEEFLQRIDDDQKLDEISQSVSLLLSLEVIRLRLDGDKDDDDDALVSNDGELTPFAENDSNSWMVLESKYSVGEKMQMLGNNLHFSGDFIVQILNKYFSILGRYEQSNALKYTELAESLILKVQNHEYRRNALFSLANEDVKAIMKHVFPRHGFGTNNPSSENSEKVDTSITTRTPPPAPIHLVSRQQQQQQQQQQHQKQPQQQQSWRQAHPSQHPNSQPQQQNMPHRPANPHPRAQPPKDQRQQSMSHQQQQSYYSPSGNTVPANQHASNSGHVRPQYSHPSPQTYIYPVVLELNNDQMLNLSGVEYVYLAKQAFFATPRANPNSPRPLTLPKIESMESYIQESLLSVLPPPVQCFQHDLERYSKIRHRISPVLDHLGQAKGEHTIFDDLDESDKRIEENTVSDGLFDGREVIVLTTQFCELINDWRELDEKFMPMLQNLYAFQKGITAMRVKDKSGRDCDLQIPSIRVTFTQHDALEKLIQNRTQLNELQKKLFDIVDNLAVCYTVLQKITLFLLGNQDNGDTFSTFVQRIFFTLFTPRMLDLHRAKILNDLWVLPMHYVQQLGKSSKALAQNVGIQARILNVILASATPRSDEKYPRNLIHHSQDLANHVKSFLHVDDHSRAQYFTVLNVNTIMEHGKYMDYIHLLNHIASLETLPLQGKELKILCDRFDIGSLSSRLAEKYPKGEDFSDQPEIRALAELCEKCLCHPQLQMYWGNQLLKLNCELSFPNETSSFLHMVLSLCANGKYKSNASWDELVFVRTKMSSVTAQTALQWIEMLTDFSPIPHSSMMTVLRAVKSIVLDTKLAGHINRCKLHSEPVDTLVNFLKRFLMKSSQEGDVAEPLDAQDVPIQVFETLLQLVEEFMFENAGQSPMTPKIPMLIDRVWELYTTVFFPFVKAIDPRKTKSIMAYKNALSWFMSSERMQLLWQKATFHEKNTGILQELLEYLVQDTTAICALFQRLNWSPIFFETDPLLLTGFVKLYMDVSLLISPSSHQVVAINPPTLREYIENLDNYDDDGIWTKITSEAFAQTFTGCTIRHLLTSNMLSRDPTSKLMEYANWLDCVAKRLNSELACVAAAREIRSLMFFSLKGSHPTSSHVHGQLQLQSRTDTLKQPLTFWYLPLDTHITMLNKTLIPMIQRFPTRGTMSLLFNCLYDIENGTKAYTLPYGRILPFANAVDCPFEDEAIAKNTQTHISGDKKGHPVLYAKNMSPVMEKFLAKFKGLISHFCSNVDATLALSITATLPVFITIVNTEFVVDLLEETVLSFLKNNLESLNPRDDLARSLQLPISMTLYSSSYDMLLENCIERNCGLLLTILVQRMINTVMEGSPTDETIAMCYSHAFSFILRFVPQSTKEYVIVYVYMKGIEMVDSPYWRHSNANKNHKKQFRAQLEYLANKQSTSLKKLIKGLSINDTLRDCTISPATSLACHLANVCLSKTFTNNEGINSGLLGSGSGYTTQTSSSSLQQNKQIKQILALRQVQPFKDKYEPFFDSCETLLENGIDLFSFRESIQKLFPLVPIFSNI